MHISSSARPAGLLAPPAGPSSDPLTVPTGEVETLILWKLYCDEGELLSCHNCVLVLPPDGALPDNVLRAEVRRARAYECIQPPQNEEEWQAWLTERVYVIDRTPLAQVTRYPATDPSTWATPTPVLHDRLAALCRQAAEDRGKTLSEEGLDGMITDLEIAVDNALDEHAE